MSHIHNHGHSHSHSHGGSDAKIGTAFLLNLVFSVIELIGGVLTNSVSIISDSVHDFGDAFSIGVSWLLERKSKKKPNELYTFGYRRFSVLGAFINCAVLIAGATLVLVNTIPRLIHPETADYSGMIILAVAGFIINGAAAFITSSGSGLNEKTVSFHMLEDVLGWLAVLIGSVVMKIWNVPIIDPLLSLGITAFILFNVIKNIKQVFEVFLEKAPDEIDGKELSKHFEECDGVISVHHLHIWSSDGTDALATVHAVIKDGADTFEVKESIRAEALEHGISHITIECERENEKCLHKQCE